MRVILQLYRTWKNYMTPEKVVEASYAGVGSYHGGGLQK